MKNILTIPSFLFSQKRKCFLRIASVIFLSFIGILFIYAEEQIVQQTFKSIKGTIVDVNGDPVIGASVVEVGTANGVVSDLNGHFTLKVHPNARLKVSFIGYQDYIVTTLNKNDIRIILKEDAQNLDEVVVVGYGTQKKANLTGAVASVTSETLENRPLANATQMLQGTMPNVQITFNSGEPGAGGNINVRGYTSINGGEPLVLIDGVPGNINNINPRDIESISVLKDAASAAIYGARAAFGVILVTTKTAKEGKFSVTYNMFVASAKPTISTDFMTCGYDAVSLVDEAFKRTLGRTYTGYTDEDMAELYARRNDVTEDPSRPWIVIKNVNGRNIYNYYGNYDWWNTFMNSHQFSQSHSVNVSGGTDKIKFMLSGNFYTKDGLMKINTDKFTSYNFRTKVEAQISPFIKVYNNTAYADKVYRFYGKGGDGNFDDLHCHALPCYAPLNPDGTATYKTEKNSYANGNGVSANLISGNAGGANQSHQLTTTTGIKIDILKNLSLNADYTYGNYVTDNWKRQAKATYSIVPGEVLVVDQFNEDRLTQTMGYDASHVFNAFASYQQTFDKHTIGGTLGMNYEHKKHRQLQGSREDLTSEILNDLNLGTSNDKATGGRHAYRLFGSFLRLNYNYAERYLVEFNGRYDGTSRFHSDKRYGFFPSISAGWRVSEEKFFQDAKKVVSNLKVRASYGSLGNQLGSDYYPYISSLESYRVGWLTERKQLNAYRAPNAISENLTWEKVYTSNVGIDLGLLNNRFSLTADAYIRDTKDMLVPGVVMPAVFGTESPQQNAGDLRTKGYELTISWNDQFALAGKPFRYSISASLGDSWSVITKFDNPTKSLKEHYVGKRVGEIWGYSIGIFQSDEEAAEYTKTVNQDLLNQKLLSSPSEEWNHYRAGDVKFYDLDNSGKIDQGLYTLDNHGDLKVIGNSEPRYNYSFGLNASWYGFDISAFFQGIGRRDWYPNHEAWAFWGPLSRPYWSFIPKNAASMYWTPENPDAYFPILRGYMALDTEGPLYHERPNDRYIQNVGYLRLKNLTIGYTFPEKWMKKIFVQHCRIYLSGDNLITWSPFHTDYMDPEQINSNYAGKSYPLSKTFSVGLDVTF